MCSFHSHKKDPQGGMDIYSESRYNTKVLAGMAKW